MVSRINGRRLPAIEPARDCNLREKCCCRFAADGRTINLLLNLWLWQVGVRGAPQTDMVTRAGPPYYDRRGARGARCSYPDMGEDVMAKKKIAIVGARAVG